MQGIPRNHEIFEPLFFLGGDDPARPQSRVRDEHQVRCRGHYSNKSRGMGEKALKAALVPKPVVPPTRQQLSFRLTPVVSLSNHGRHSSSWCTKSTRSSAQTVVGR
jgi:hypothetical protein